VAYVGNKIQSQFVVSVGDNFYDQGISSVDDVRWLYSYEQVYYQPALQIPWYIVAGNRDYYGNVSAEIEYTKRSSRWKFEDVSYTKIFQIPNTNATLLIVAFNSWDLTSASRELGSPLLDPVKQLEAINFISDALRHSNATWKILVSHYPIWSAGAHGPYDPDLLRMLEPIVLTWKPDIYLAGHDHNLQHVRVNNMSYYVVGGGSSVSSSWNGISGLPPGSALFTFPSPNLKNNIGGFASVNVTDTLMTITFYNEIGVKIYQYSHTPNQTPPDVSPTFPPAEPVQPPTTAPSNITLIPRSDPHVIPDSGVISDSVLYGIVYGVVGCLVVLGVSALGVFMYRKRQMEIDEY